MVPDHFGARSSTSRRRNQKIQSGKIKISKSTASSSTMRWTRLQFGLVGPSHSPSQLRLQNGFHTDSAAQLKSTKVSSLELGNDDDGDSDSVYLPEIPLTRPAQGLVITTTSQGRFVHWPGLRPSLFARDYESCLVAHIDNLPYQEGVLLTSIREESSTEIATSSSGSYYPDREVFVITQNNNPGTSQNRTPRRLAQLDNVSEDKSTADAPQNETSNQRNQRRMCN